MRIHRPRRSLEGLSTGWSALGRCAPFRDTCLKGEELPSATIHRLPARGLNLQAVHSGKMAFFHRPFNRVNSFFKAAEIQCLAK